MRWSSFCPSTAGPTPLFLEGQKRRLFGRGSTRDTCAENYTGTGSVFINGGRLSFGEPATVWLELAWDVWARGR